ncbi:MAG: LysR family transcriptional regulator [Proteobacteria bacterium]|nr:LysR family transcriptional regulator [Pseudomonadota bacterium]
MSLLSPQLQAFLATAQKGTVHQAALVLHITQTGVTQRLKSLETQLGAALFERSRKGMRLTAEGEALLRYCQKVLEIEGETLALLETQGQAIQQSIQRVSILGPSSIMRARVIPSCVPLVKRFPQLRFTFEIEDSVELALSKLRSALVQLVVIPSDHLAKEMGRKQLKPESYALYVPRAWKKRSLQDIVENENIIDFNEDDDFTFNYLRLFKGMNHRGGERHFANNTDALASMIMAGIGYSVLAEDFVASLSDSHELEKLKLNKNLEFSFVLAWYPRPQMPNYLRALIEAIS